MKIGFFIMTHNVTDFLYKHTMITIKTLRAGQIHLVILYGRLYLHSS